jgi:circadian clock protein KaiC
MHKAVNEFQPDLVLVDPITNLISVGTRLETQSMMTRLIDFLKMRGTTTFFTSLTAGGGDLEQSEVGISSLIDTWLMLEVVRSGGERNRVLTIIKSRGMAHSNQTSEFRLSDAGVELANTYLGASGVLTGSARIAKEAEDEAAALGFEQEIARKKEERERRRRQLESQMLALREELSAQDANLEREIQAAAKGRDRLLEQRKGMAKSRHAFAGPSDGAEPRRLSQRKRP